MQDWAWLGWTRGNHSCGVLAGVVTRRLLGCRMLHRSIRRQLHGSSPRPPLAQGAAPRYSDQLCPVSRVIAQSGP